MKIVFLSSSSNETTKYAQGLARLGWGELDLLRYDVHSATDQKTYAQVKGSAPDIIIYVGSRWGPQVSTHMLARMNFEIAPTVHFCSDAADPPWWDLLREYHAAGAFTLQVAIDGNKNWPLGGSQMTALTPVDAIYFRHVNGHEGRLRDCCYAGNAGAEGHVRRSILSELALHGAIAVRLRDAEPESYQQYADFLMGSRMSINVPHTGTGAALHVKGRVVESALAGCLLIEMKGSPTSQWFTPGDDYVEYENVGHALELIEQYKRERGEAEVMANRLRAKVLAEHSVEAFWGRIFERVGVKI